MKVVRIHRHGGPEVLQLEELPNPEPAAGQVVVRLHAAGINHLDLWVRKGLPGLKTKFPHILGCDGAGVVESLGPAATGPAPGTRVLLNPHSSCGVCEACTGGDMSMCRQYAILGEHGPGTYAERIAIESHRAIPIPDWMPFDQAAATALSLLTAWRMMLIRGRLRPSETVLVVSAGGGVGTFCVQIAKQTGCRVIATAGSEEKLARLRELGADETVDHSREDYSKRVRELTGGRGVDMVVDYTGKETWMKSILSLRRGGRLVTCGATSGFDPVEDLRHVFYRQLEIIGSTMGTNKDLLDPLRLVFDKKVRPIVDSTFPIEQAAMAHRRVEERRAFGKVVLTL